MWLKANSRRARTVWCVQKSTSLYCNVAFKTRKRQNLCHIGILRYPKLKTISSLIYRYRYNIDILPSPTLYLGKVGKLNFLNLSSKDMFFIPGQQQCFPYIGCTWAHRPGRLRPAQVDNIQMTFSPNQQCLFYSAQRPVASSPCPS